MTRESIALEILKSMLAAGVHRDDRTADEIADGAVEMADALVRALATGAPPFELLPIDEWQREGIETHEP